MRPDADAGSAAQVDPDTPLQRRMARLTQELHDEVGLHLTTEALEELAYARFMEPHEGKRAAYGAVIWTERHPSAGVPTLPSTAAFLDSQASLDVLRGFADGRTSFVMRSPGSKPAVAIDPAWRGTESALAAYASSAAVTVIQRLSSGRIRLFLGDRVYSEEGGTWLARPTAVAYQGKLSALLDVAHHTTARAILDLCVHKISPAGHGATLVWFPDGATGPDPHLDLTVAINPPALSAADPLHAPAIAHALGQLDRAAVLGASGQLVHLNVTLGHAEAHGARGFTGGTRHNSAGRYSASDNRAVVFVVSADGPVTVLRRGEVVAAIA